MRTTGTRQRANELGLAQQVRAYPFRPFLSEALTADRAEQYVLAVDDYLRVVCLTVHPNVQITSQVHVELILLLLTRVSYQVSGVGFVDLLDRNPSQRCWRYRMEHAQASCIVHSLTRVQYGHFGRGSGIVFDPDHVLRGSELSDIDVGSRDVGVVLVLLQDLLQFFDHETRILTPNDLRFTTDVEPYHQQHGTHVQRIQPLPECICLQVRGTERHTALSTQVTYPVIERPSYSIFH